VKPQRPLKMRSQRGFTLVELIMVIVLLGVVGGMVSVFMKGPIDAYLDSGRRAALTDVADTTVRRMARDVRSALPNSIRTSGTNCLEFIPTKTGGRYRVQDLVAGDGHSLDFSINDTSFNMLGSNNALPASQRIAINDLIVVYNLGIIGADAYDVTNANGGKNWTTVSALPTEPGTYAPVETEISISGFRFPLASDNNRFHVVSSTEKMVSYVCSGTNLLRASSNTLTATASCPTSTSGTASVSIIASNVNCTSPSTSFIYSGSDLQRNALVTMVLGIQDSSLTESISVHHEVHVDNSP